MLAFHFQAYNLLFIYVLGLVLSSVNDIQEYDPIRMIRILWLVGWLAGCLVGWLFGRLVVSSVGCFVGWLFRRLVGCLVGWLFGRLVVSSVG